VGGGAGSGEDVADDEVPAGGFHGGEGFAGVGGADADAGFFVEREVGADEFGERGVDFDGELARAWSGVGEVAGQGEGAAAEVEGVDGVVGGEGVVGEVGEASDVLEFEVGGVVEVDVGLGGVVDGEEVGGGVVGVGHEAGEAAAGVCGGGCGGGSARHSGLIIDGLGRSWPGGRFG